MDKVDRRICEIVQRDGRASSATIAEYVAVPTSTANDRLRRLAANETIQRWQAVLNPDHIGAGLAAFVLIDMTHDGEAEAVETLCARPEIMELHHISGAHSYLAKVRVQDMLAMQRFLADVIKPLKAIHHTETTFAMKTLKETSAMMIAGLEDGE